ncbi:hypothetical protein TNCV_563091 [Trichonephila clavipes]|nr:hypothetical protein TNCV_563091 [Trichonephila clavipes]
MWKGAVRTSVNGISFSHACTATCSNGMKCRSSSIQIYPSMGKSFKGDGNFGISNWSPEKSIRQASNDIPLLLCSPHLYYNEVSLTSLSFVIAE